MRSLIALGALVALVACGESIDESEREAADARDVAMVEAANEAMPPLRMVTPEPILLPDIERYDLLGEACNYAPGTSLGTRVVARPSDAFMKIDGDVVRLAADPGSRELPMQTRTLYTGREYSLRLVIQEGAVGEEAPGGAVNYEGTVEVRDEYGRIVYEGTGLAQCKS